MKNPMTETPLDPFLDWKGFFNEIQNESERGAVIIAGAFLDAQLRNLLSKSMINDTKYVDKLLGTDNDPRGYLSSFNSRILAAYCLELISKSMYDDLNLINRIRNPFAHKLHGFSFDDPKIVKWCKSLNITKMQTDVSISQFPQTHRSMFILSVTTLAMRLALKTIEVDRGPK